MSEFRATLSLESATSATWTDEQIAAGRNTSVPASVSADPSHYNFWAAQAIDTYADTLDITGTPLDSDKSNTLSEASVTGNVESVVDLAGGAYTSPGVALGASYTGDILLRFWGYRGPR